MTEYIDREAVIKTLKAEGDGEGVFSAAVYYTAALVVKQIPAADVAPVRRGRWVKMDMHKGMEQYKCSVCNQECFVPTCMGEPLYNYCPNCGAHMTDEEG